MSAAAGDSKKDHQNDNNFSEKNSKSSTKTTTTCQSTEDKPSPFSNYFPSGGPTYWSIIASLSFLCTGLLRAYTSPALLSLQNESSSPSSLQFSTNYSKNDIISWIASTPPLCSFLGTLISGPLLLYWGRQKTLFLLFVIATGGWILVAKSWSISVLLIGRGLTGLASGLATATAPLYISEVVKNRKAVNTSTPTSTISSGGGDRKGLLPGVMLATGILLGFILAHQLQLWRPLALVISIFPGVLALLSWTIPESPFFLSSKTPIKNEDNQKEIQFDLEMEQVVPPKTSTKNPTFSEKSGLIPKANSSAVGFPSLYFRVGVLMLLQQWSGGNVLIYYLSEILTKNLSPSPTQAGGQLSPDQDIIHKASLIIALVQFIGFFLAMPLIDHPRLGRRFLLIISAVLMMLTHLFLGFHFHHEMIKKHSESYLNDHHQTNNNYYSPDFVIRVASLSTLLACYSIGLGPIPFLFIENSESSNGNGESNSSSNSSYLSSFASLVNHLSLFLAVKGFPYLFHKEDLQEEGSFLKGAGPDLTFWLFAGVCWITVIFTVYFIPSEKYDLDLDLDASFSSEKEETNKSTHNSS